MKGIFYPGMLPLKQAISFISGISWLTFLCLMNYVPVENHCLFNVIELAQCYCLNSTKVNEPPNQGDMKIIHILGFAAHMASVTTP